MPMNLADMTLPERVIEQIAVSNAALEKAASLEKRTSDQRSKTAAMIPKVLDALVDNERILPSEREKVASMLQDPASALQILASVAQHRNAAEISHIGQPMAKTAGVKTAAANPYVGARNADMQESDRVLLEGLGLTVAR